MYFCYSTNQESNMLSDENYLDRDQGPLARSRKKMQMISFYFVL